MKNAWIRALRRASGMGANDAPPRGHVLGGWGVLDDGAIRLRSRMIDPSPDRPATCQRKGRTTPHHAATCRGVGARRPDDGAICLRSKGRCSTTWLRADVVRQKGRGAGREASAPHPVKSPVQKTTLTGMRRAFWDGLAPVPAPFTLNGTHQDYTDCSTHRHD